MIKDILNPIFWFCCKNSTKKESLFEQPIEQPKKEKEEEEEKPVEQLNYPFVTLQDRRNSAIKYNRGFLVGDIVTLSIRGVSMCVGRNCVVGTSTVIEVIPKFGINLYRLKPNEENNSVGTLRTQYVLIRVSELLPEELEVLHLPVTEERYDMKFRKDVLGDKA